MLSTKTTQLFLVLLFITSLQLVYAIADDGSKSETASSLLGNGRPDNSGLMIPLFQRPRDPQPFRVNASVVFIGLPLASIILPLCSTLSREISMVVKNKLTHWLHEYQQPQKVNSSKASM